MKVNIQNISYYLPEIVETNDDLHRDNPEWDIEKITEKTGILKRYKSDKNQTALDMGYLSAKELLRDFDSESIDSLIFVTQSPDYILPTSACILQDKLNLPSHCLAFDINLGCSGFVYALSVAGSLIETGLSDNTIIICSDTYSKYIHSSDRTNRPIFSDGASAVVLSKSKDNNLGPFIFGTDGSGFDSLIVRQGGARGMNSENQQYEKVLDMKGSDVFLFTMNRIPKTVKQLINKAGLDIEDIDLFVFHQASRLVIDNLRRSIDIKKDKVFTNYENIGNTVSATIPIALKDAEDQGKLKNGDKVMLIGFGVGLSWGAAILNWVNT
tara:strand:+ start:1171 stop:2148 length:978 start_codon:yes stop_codon:yes gene_type:complete